jgi:hypothetical protein
MVTLKALRKLIHKKLKKPKLFPDLLDRRFCQTKNGT